MARVTFVEVQETFKLKKSVIEKHTTSKHYLIGKDQKHVYFKGKLNELVEEVSNIGVDEFVKKYDYEELQKMKEVKKVTKKVTAKAKKTEDASLKKEIDSLEVQMVDIALEIMKFQSHQRGCKEDLDLRSKLHQVHHKLKELQSGQRI